jgi:hypothetical protein
LTRVLVLTLGMAVLSALVTGVCYQQWRDGSAAAFGGMFKGERERTPLRYWLALGTWALVALLPGIRAVQGVLQMAAGAPSPPATARDWISLAMLLAFLGVLAVVRLKLWRRGNPLLHWRELRREGSLRARIRALVDDPGATYEGESIDEFAAFAELEWLEEIVAHLEQQSAPRDLARAIDETDALSEAEPAR